MTEVIHSVFIIDDYKDGVIPLLRALELRGHKCRAAYNALDALQNLQEFVPDVIVLDLAMPNMDGMTFLEQLRANSRHRATRVILYTAHTALLDLKALLKLGVHEIQIK